MIAVSLRSTQSPFFQAEGRLIGRREEPHLFINVPDKPIRPLLLALHIEAAAEGFPGLKTRKTSR